MLSLGRKYGESIIITASNGERIKVVVRPPRSGGTNATLCVDAPPSVAINREEIQTTIDRGAKA